MKVNFVKIVFSLFLITVSLIGDLLHADPLRIGSMLTPTITGNDTACADGGEYIYLTEPGMTNYIWTVSPDGNIASGGTLTSSTITITWSTPGAKTVSVSYDGASGPAILNVTALPSLPVSISIVASDDTVCEGTAVTFTATAINGGSTPFYQWKINAINTGNNSPTYSYTPANGDFVSCHLTSSEICTSGNPAISNSIEIDVIQNSFVNVSISASANPICLGSSVTFTATPYNGGTLPSYQWKVNNVNAGTNSPTFTYVPINSDHILCILTSNVTCPTGNPATSSTIIMTVSPIQPVSVSITASANPSCLGNQVTFTAIGVNGGGAGVYAWNVNNVNVGTNSQIYTYTPSNGDVIKCILTSNAGCPSGNPSTSNSIVMVVNTYEPVGISITALANPVCNGTTVTFTSTSVNGGSAPTYQWKVNGFDVGGNSTNYTYVPSDGNLVSCTITSNLLCTTGNPAISNQITMMVSPSLPAGVFISTPTNPSCQGIPVTFTATPTNGGVSPNYQWKVNGIIAGTNNAVFTYVPVSGDVVTCRMTSSNPCASVPVAYSNEIVMTMGSNLPVSVAIIASINPVCLGTQVTLTATPMNGGAIPVYQWKVNGSPFGSNSPVYTYIPADGDVVTCVLTSSITCATGNPATSNAITIHVSLNLPVSVTITASSNPG